MTSKITVIAPIALGVAVVATVAIVRTSNDTHAVQTNDGSKSDAASPAKQSTSNPNLPPAGAPLVSTYQELWNQSNSGNGAAAKRLFADVSECLLTSRLDKAYQDLSKQRDWIVNNPDAYGARGGSSDEKRSAALATIEQNEIRIQQAAELCAGASNLNDGRIYQVALDAARAGDQHALACLLIAPYDGPTLVGNQGQEYASNVMQLAQSAVQQGSWPAAISMMYVYSGQPLSAYAGTLGSYDAMKEFEYSQLVRLGTPDGSIDAQNLDRRLGLMQQTLSQQQIQDGKSWANQTYQQYFFYSGPAFPDSLPCSF